MNKFTIFFEYNKMELNMFEDSDDDVTEFGKTKEELKKTSVMACNALFQGQKIIDNQRADMEYLLTQYNGYNPSYVKKLTDFELCKLLRSEYLDLNFETTSTLEIYGPLEERKKNGQILNQPISIEDKYTQTLISFIKSALYNLHEVKFREFEAKKAIYLIRWIGSECYRFFDNLMMGNIEKLLHTKCLGRWKFLHKFWNSKHMSFFMSYSDAQKIIQNNKYQYVIRLSSTVPGQLALHYWNPKNKTPDAFLLEIDNMGNIELSNSKINNFNSLDQQFRFLYKNRFNIDLDTSKFDQYSPSTELIINEYHHGY